MSAHKIVERLDFCKQVREGQWIARCPAHDDKTPSLGIKDAGGGRTLINCHAGCGAIEILQAIGLDFGDLYPPTDQHFSARRIKAPTETIDSLVVEIAAHDRRMGKRLSKADTERLREALKRTPKTSDVVTEIFYEGFVRANR